MRDEMVEHHECVERHGRNTPEIPQRRWHVIDSDSAPPH